MIQQVDTRRIDTLMVQPNLRQAPQEQLDCWGQWHGRRHYSLEVVQHPLRARMCGFGDKDRRPLAPAAVAKMVVRKEDNTLVDVDDVDSTFFLVAVDLWSADGKVDRNLVLHPSSDRYVPPQSAKAKRRLGSTSAPQQPRPSGNQTPTMAPATTGPYRQADQSTPITPISSHPPSSNYYSSNSTYPPPPPQYASSSAPETPTWGYASQQDSPADRTTGFPPPALPSIQSFGREPANNTNANNNNTSHSYRGYENNASASYQSTDNSQVDPALRGPESDGKEGNWSQDGSSAVYPSGNSFAPPPPPFYSSNYPPVMPATIPPGGAIPRHTYTRTLVGPLTANAARLLDEHRKPGIFFLFQDLSVRTEGTFRLRLRLLNIGAPPAPEIGSAKVHQDVSPVLAQTFTEQFVVYSAKRFPGVPDTTALSIAFGNQGQKLPLRNRHGSGKRVRQDDSGSDEDSDGA